VETRLSFRGVMKIEMICLPSDGDQRDFLRKKGIGLVSNHEVDRICLIYKQRDREISLNPFNHATSRSGGWVPDDGSIHKDGTD